jgi:uncharacterized protein
MLLDLSRLRGKGHLERRYEPSAFGPRDDDFRVKAPVELTADVHKDGRKVRLTGRLRTELECDCGRCLDPFAVPVDVPLDLLFLPATENAGEGEQEVDQDDLGVSFYKDDTIDLGDVMREQFYLALPMKPLCREACRGLCPVCGVNRNRETCACQSEWVDPRLDALRSLRNRS